MELYRRALAHRSGCNERLEFLGDAVLGVVVASYLCERYPSANEGFLTRLRSRLVNGRMLSELCRVHTPLPNHVPTARALTGTVLEDVFEAFLGAMFVDRGFEPTRRWIVGLFEENVDFAELVAHMDDHKSALNRMYSRAYGYVPALEKLSDTTVRLVTPSGTVIASGVGADVGRAHDAAARAALRQFDCVVQRRALARAGC